MQQNKEYLLSVLRNKETTRETFRSTARLLSRLLALETLNFIALKKHTVTTPIGSTQGLRLDQRIVLVPVLRSGITMVEPFLEVYPEAYVAVVGLRRDEKTAQAQWYYKNIPALTKHDQIIIVDPMIATGGTGYEVLTLLSGLGAQLNNAIFANIISAPEGINYIKKHFPDITIITAATDTGLNTDKFITPGLGDFGDRYFGTENMEKGA